MRTMRREPLETVRWLRQRAVDEARHKLALSIAAAAEAAAVARSEEVGIEREFQLAADLMGDDSLVETFAAWLSAARQRVAQAHAAQERHETEARRRRADLNASQSALEAIETLLQQRRAARADKAMRQAEQAMDEIAARSAHRQD